MPYSVSEDAAGCDGYAVVKDGTGEVMGCHESEAEAQAQLTALNIAEFGERSAHLDIPDYISAAAARGLEYRAQGFGGDGLTEQTIREARAMAEGEVSDDKVIRANAWGARHAVDLEAPKNSDPDDDGWPGAGAVAHYLWGIDPLNPEPARAWFERKADDIKQEIAEGEDDEDDDDDERSARMERNVPLTNLVRAASLDRAADVSEDGRTLSGYFSVFNEWYEVNSAYEGRFMERIAPGAFADTLAKNAARIKVLYDHGADPSMGNKPLGIPRVMTEDKRGGYYEVELIDTDYNRDFIIPAARAGLLGSSFRFMVVGESWNDPKRATSANPMRLPERTITSTEVFEFGPVTFPANPGVGAVGIRSTTDEWFDRLLHDPQFVARFTARVGLSNVERALESAPVASATTDCATVRVVDGPPDGRSDEQASQPTDGRSKARTKNQRLAVVAKALPPKEKP